jgi:hypothetical protein
MQASTGEKLRREWDDFSCSHLMIDKEYVGARKTGNYICIVCGTTFAERELVLLFYLIALSTFYLPIDTIKIIKTILVYF